MALLWLCYGFALANHMEYKHVVNHFQYKHFVNHFQCSESYILEEAVQPLYLQISVRIASGYTRPLLTSWHLNTETKLLHILMRQPFSFLKLKTSKPDNAVGIQTVQMMNIRHMKMCCTDINRNVNRIRSDIT